MSLSRPERFWFDRSMEPGRLAALRIGFFTLFAVDQLHLMTSHAWRFGAGGINLAHFDWLDTLLPLPRVEIHLGAYLLSAFLSLCVAAGIATRVFIPLIATLYGYAYFSSMADGYQHHYLLFWILVVCSFVRFDQAPGIASPPAEGRIRSWGLSLLYAQIAIVYLFTAITKVDPQWVSGWALEQQVSTPSVRALFESTNAALGLGPLGAYAIVATSVMLWQFLAAASFVDERLHAIACLTGLVFHVTIEFIGIEIRWFSYYMIALYYLLLLPDTWYAWVAERLSTAFAPLTSALSSLFAPIDLDERRAGQITALAAFFALGLVGNSPLPGAALLTTAVLVAIGIAWWTEPRTRGVAGRGAVFVAAAAVIGLVPLRSGAVYDFYRYQGGDYLRRGDLHNAAEAYYAAIDANPGPDSRHAKLATVLVELGREREAKAVLERGLAHDPDDARLKRQLQGLTEKEGS
ncbi:MAG: tetratricopeptide repeat protein [Deltaproteobacteria bacterium]|nr:MAG: tetratricopeptide repeat protein [Deltaproteobacteria bacterium]